MKAKGQNTSSTTNCTDSIVKAIKQFTTVSNCYYIGNREKQMYIYKYMDIETAILCLKNNNIRFVEPTLWQDKYESRFYTADYSKIIKDKKNIIPKLYSCCFTLSKASEAAWRIYSYDKLGLASRCVQFRINKRLFREKLDEYAKKNSCKIYEGNINYTLSDFRINHLHLVGHYGYNEVFNSDFNLNNYLSLLLLKRSAFNYENEFRYFIIPDNGMANKQIFPTIEWSDIVVDVKVDRNCSEIEIEILTHYLNEHGVEIKPTKFDLYTNPDKKIIIGEEYY